MVGQLYQRNGGGRIGPKTEAGLGRMAEYLARFREATVQSQAICGVQRRRLVRPPHRYLTTGVTSV